ncbi:unnamed protein product, partial [Prorocentrum cordatum]
RQDAMTVPEHERTTVMLRNLPNNYSRAMLLHLIDQERVSLACTTSCIFRLIHEGRRTSNRKPPWGAQPCRQQQS